jgi:hypothetical protein
MAIENIYKTFDSQTDIKSVQRIEREELFNPRKFLTKPYNETGSLSVSYNASQSFSGSYYCEVGYVSKANSDIDYFSFTRASSGSLAEATGSVLFYRYIMNQLQPDNSVYEVALDSYQATHSVVDVLSVSREWYKDGIDARYFSVLIHNTGSATSDSVLSGSLGLGSDVVALFANYNNSYNTPLGTKYYLYPTVSSGSIYNTVTDEFNMKSPLDLSVSEPVGEVFVNAGIVFLFPQKIKQLYPNVVETSILSYVGGIGGRSLIQLNSSIFFARILNTEFNYSTNPTYYDPTNDTFIREELIDEPVTYPTMIGLYNQKNELVAVGSISQPAKKSFDNEAVFRLELSY